MRNQQGYRSLPLQTPSIRNADCLRPISVFFLSRWKVCGTSETCSSTSKSDRRGACSAPCSYWLQGHLKVPLTLKSQGWHPNCLPTHTQAANCTTDIEEKAAEGHRTNIRDLSPLALVSELSQRGAVAHREPASIAPGCRLQESIKVGSSRNTGLGDLNMCFIYAQFN